MKATSLTLLANRAMRAVMPVSKRWNGAMAMRGVSSATTEMDVDMDKVNDMFAEARLMLQDANDSMGTVYFEEEYNDAKSLTNDTLAAYRRLVARSEADESRRIVAANEPKMKQLEEELRVLTDSLIHDDH